MMMWLKTTEGKHKANPRPHFRFGIKHLDLFKLYETAALNALRAVPLLNPFFSLAAQRLQHICNFPLHVTWFPYINTRE